MGSEDTEQSDPINIILGADSFVIRSKKPVKLAKASHCKRKLSYDFSIQLVIYIAIIYVTGYWKNAQEMKSILLLDNTALMHFFTQTRQ